MTHSLEIYCENNNKYYQFPLGTNLKEVYDIIKPKLKNHVLAARVNNKLQDLSYELMQPKRVKFIDMTGIDGYSVYTRSLCFILCKAIGKLYPNERFRIVQHICDGLYCKFKNKHIILNENDISNIEKEMKKYVDQDLRIYRDTVETATALQLFAAKGLCAKNELLISRKQPYTSVYRIEDDVDYFYGVLAYSTKSLNNFQLYKFHQGVLLRLPERKTPNVIPPYSPQEKKFRIHTEYRRWGRILGISNISDLNKHVDNNTIGDIIKISEAQQEKKIAQIADRVYKRRNRTKVILIAGPSSSGKTTFSKRLAIQLQVIGLKPINLSLDDYFVDRELSPRDENGEFDFESIKALNIKQFTKDINDLIEGKSIQIGKFDFEEGKRKYTGESLEIDRKNIIIIEGIHGLNPMLTHHLPKKALFKIFISAMTSISIDDHNLISSTDNRLIRRMVRDYKYRHYSAVETIQRWGSVLDGEIKHIIPYQEEADIMFNSALPYELGVLKNQAEKILNGVYKNDREYSKAERLLKFFSYFRSIEEKEIPPTSILREFVGGSTFEY
ncbi:nucleoside kinase [Marinilabiliaceae bacterium JC040]|nr:nucleoside kinase [Marinilabiliaceae bacterium JC040]